MQPHYADDAVTLYHGDCLDVLRELPDASVDAVVTDPPYGLEFMGKEWDAPWKSSDAGVHAEARTRRAAEVTPTGQAHSTSAGPYLAAGVNRYAAGLPFQQWCEQWAAECLRVLKPGGHMLAFGGTRTWHRLACAIEDAGFEVRDSIAWLYGSGFPKSLDVSKAIDKAAGAERLPGAQSLAPMPDEPSGKVTYNDGKGNRLCTTCDKWTFATDHCTCTKDAPATPDAQKWQGWGTALKPAGESIVVATKPQAGHGILDAIGSELDRLEAAWSPDVNSAASSSPPTPPGSREARTDSAPASAATRQGDASETTTRTGAVDDSPAATDTSPSVSTGPTYSNIVTSWRNCWAAICEAMSTSTIATTSRTTTDLRTLCSCLAQITPESTTTDPTRADGQRSLVEAADSLFAAAYLNLSATRTLTAIGSATSETPPTSQGGIARETITLARKPLTGTVAANVLAHGTGALNVDATRIGYQSDDDKRRNDVAEPGMRDSRSGFGGGYRAESNAAGRWPANVVLDPAAAAELDRQSGVRPGASSNSTGASAAFTTPESMGTLPGYGDTGGASRFFYVAKAGSSERPRDNDTAHPTVKPLDLMRWLVRLVTPPGGIVLEPFAGSGTTAEACIVEGFRCIAIEREADYLPLILQRITKPIEPVMF